MSACKHCHEQVEPYGDGTHHRHVTGAQARKNTCALEPYGDFLAEPAEELVVTFERIGRTHNPPELRIPVADVQSTVVIDYTPLWPGDLTNWSDVAQRISNYARPLVASSYLETAIEERDGRIYGYVLVGGIRNAGKFSIAHPGEAAALKPDG